MTRGTDARGPPSEVPAGAQREDAVHGGGAPSAADPFDASPFAPRRERRADGRANGASVRRRALLLAAVAWVPLVVLAVAEGYALRDDPRESLLLDVSAYARYLVALPLLVLADAACLPRMALVARNFGAAGFVRETDRPRYEQLLASTRRLLASPSANLVIVLAAYAASLLLGRIVGQVPFAHADSTWALPIVDGARSPSLAGLWRGVVSQPLLLIVTGTWIWRMVLWTRFLWGVARLDPRVVPSHPDLAGGLRFVSTSLPPFAVPAFALGTWAAGSEANNVLLHAARTPRDLAYVVPLTLLLALVLFVAPLLTLVHPLRHAKARGVIEYGDLAHALGRRFEERWLEGGTVLGPDALDVQDFSATTDLYSITENVREMRVVPLALRGVVPLVVATLLPFVPVLLMALPLEQMLRVVARLLL